MNVNALSIARKGSDAERVVSKATTNFASERPLVDRMKQIVFLAHIHCVVILASYAPQGPVSRRLLPPVPFSGTGSGMAVAVVKTDTAVDAKLHANNNTPSVSDAAVVEQNKKSELEVVEDLTREIPRLLKRPKKPSRDHVSLYKWNQDESSRLLEYPKFQNTPKAKSMLAYESRTMIFCERMRKALVHDKRVNKDVLRLIEGKGDDGWARNQDVLEGFFWEILHKGVDGKAIAMNYGVDVEVEGAYKGESYVEWYGMGDTDRMVKKRSAL